MKASPAAMPPALCEPVSPAEGWIPDMILAVRGFFLRMWHSLFTVFKVLNSTENDGCVVRILKAVYQSLTTLPRISKKLPAVESPGVIMTSSMLRLI